LPYAEVFQDEWGAGPRATPFTDGKNVYFQSCNGEFRCVDFEKGTVLWGFNFADYGIPFRGSKSNVGVASRRGNNGAGILDGPDVLVPVGSPRGATLVCLDKNTGALKWKSGRDEAAYSSLMVADIAGARQVVMFTADALAGFDRLSGKLLWRVPLVTAAQRHAMTPVIHGNEIVVNSHTFGMICFEISHESGEFKAVQKWKNARAKVNLGTPVWIGDALYSHGENRNFICVDAKSGQLKWSEPGFGSQYSSVLSEGGKLFVVTDTGEAMILNPNPEKYEEIARAQLAGKTWNHPALGEGKIVIRDNRSLTCYQAK
jgi:outer membrane protein assembly factor BamB